MATVGLLVERKGLFPPAVAVPKVAEVTVDGYAIGDYELAFARLYARAYDVAYKVLGYRSEAEDVAQEAMARAYLHWPKVHGYAEPWVVRVAGNLAIGSWRKTRRLSSLGDHKDDDRAATAAVTSLGDHLELRRALAGLSKRQREVVVLRHLAGFSERETAQALGCSTGAVKQHASRGLAALREQLQDREQGEPADADDDDRLGRAEGQ